MRTHLVTAHTFDAFIIIYARMQIAFLKRHHLHRATFHTDITLYTLIVKIRKIGKVFFERIA